MIKDGDDYILFYHIGLETIVKQGEDPDVQAIVSYMEEITAAYENGEISLQEFAQEAALQERAFHHYLWDNEVDCEDVFSGVLDEEDSFDSVMIRGQLANNKNFLSEINVQHETHEDWENFHFWIHIESREKDDKWDYPDEDYEHEDTYGRSTEDLWEEFSEGFSEMLEDIADADSAREASEIYFSQERRLNHYLHEISWRSKEGKWISPGELEDKIYDILDDVADNVNKESIDKTRYKKYLIREMVQQTDSWCRGEDRECDHGEYCLNAECVSAKGGKEDCSNGQDDDNDGYWDCDDPDCNCDDDWDKRKGWFDDDDYEESECKDGCQDECPGADETDCVNDKCKCYYDDEDWDDDDDSGSDDSPDDEGSDSSGGSGSGDGGSEEDGSGTDDSGSEESDGSSDDSSGEGSESDNSGSDSGGGDSSGDSGSSDGGSDNSGGSNDGGSDSSDSGGDSGSDSGSDGGGDSSGGSDSGSDGSSDAGTASAIDVFSEPEKGVNVFKLWFNLAKLSTYSITGSAVDVFDDVSASQSEEERYKERYGDPEEQEPKDEPSNEEQQKEQDNSEEQEEANDNVNEEQEEGQGEEGVEEDSDNTEDESEDVDGEQEGLEEDEDEKDYDDYEDNDWEDDWDDKNHDEKDYEDDWDEDYDDWDDHDDYDKDDDYGWFEDVEDEWHHPCEDECQDCWECDWENDHEQCNKNCVPCNLCQYEIGDFECHDHQYFNEEWAYCECEEGYSECDGDWLNGCEMEGRCEDCQEDSDCAPARCSEDPRRIVTFICEQGEGWEEEKRMLEIGAECNVHSNGEKETSFWIGGWGEELDDFEMYKQEEHQKGEEDWCQQELEWLTAERVMIQESFNDEFIAWFFNEFVDNDPAKFEDHMGMIHSLHKILIENTDRTAWALACLGENEFPVEYQPIQVSYESVYGEIEIWEEFKWTDHFEGQEINVLHPYMKIWIFPPKEFIVEKMKEEFGGLKGPPPHEIAEIKENEVVMKKINKISKRFDDGAEIKIQVVDNGEVLFQNLIKINPDIIMRMQSIDESYTGPVDATMSIDMDFLYELTATIVKEIEGAHVEGPWWEERHDYERGGVEEAWIAIKVLGNIIVALTNGNIDVEPDHRTDDIVFSLKEIITMMSMGG